MTRCVINLGSLGVFFEPRKVIQRFMMSRQCKISRTRGETLLHMLTGPDNHEVNLEETFPIGLNRQHFPNHYSIQIIALCKCNSHLKWI